MSEQLMRGAALLPSGDHYRLEVREMPIPPVGPGEVLVRVHASAVSHMCESFLHGLANARVEALRASLQQDVLTGIEFSGVVASEGERFRNGEEVFGYIAVLRDRRAHCDYIAVSEAALALKPRGASHAEAASMAANALTVRQAFTEVVEVKRGDRILVIGASGSVGIHAVQLAAHLGAYVVAVCNPVAMSGVLAQGADEVVDYSGGLGAHDAPFDVIFDTAPAYDFARCDHLLAKGGTYISTLPSQDPDGAGLAEAAGKKWGYLMVLEVPGDALARTADLIEAGGMRPVIDSRFSLDEIAAAHARFSEHGKLGKVVVDILEATAVPPRGV